MTTFQKAALLKSLQKLDHEMRTRHYPAVIEADEPRYEDPRSEEQYFLEEQCPSESAFR